MKYGGPAGIQMFLDVLSFTLFVLAVGRLGDAAMGATSLTVTFNMIAFLPMLPRTRSGKIMRRLLKARELGLPEGDTSTMEGGA